MGNRMITLDDLYSFFVNQNKNVKFSSKQDNSPIVVSVPGNFESSEDSMPGMLKLKLKVCHTETNRNGSHISKENMEAAMPTLKYRPILAYIHKLEDGTYDFYAHNIEVKEDENGEEYIDYLEKQVGCFTADAPYLEYDKEQDKTYVNAFAVIPEEYTLAADIIRRKNGTKVSCELVIDELSYNAKEKYLDLTSFYFGATTLLGCDENGIEIGEGMLGSRADIADFCHKAPDLTTNDKLIETLEKLNNTLSSFNINQNLQKGGDEEMNKFNELLSKYGKTETDVTFDIEGLSDEELELKFKEAFEEESVDETEEVVVVEEEDEVVEENSTSESGDDEETVLETDECKPKKKKKCSVDENGNMSVAFDISHEDIRYALYNLIGVYEEEDNDWYFITNVYDEYFIMENWDGNKCYKQSYGVNGDNVELSGERQEMFKMLLTESEKISIDKMRENYADLETKYNELKKFKDGYDAAQTKAQKEEIFGREEYSEIADTEGFKSLVSDMDKYSVDEVEIKCDLLFAAHEKAKHKNFAAKNNEKKSSFIQFSVSTTDEINKKPYGDLF